MVPEVISSHSKTKTNKQKKYPTKPHSNQKEEIFKLVIFKVYLYMLFFQKNYHTLIVSYESITINPHLTSSIGSAPSNEKTYNKTNFTIG